MKFKKIQASKNWKFSRKREDFDIYKQIRNEFIRLLQRKKCDFNKQAIYSAANDQKLMWKRLNGLLKSKQTQNVDEVYFDGVPCNDAQMISNNFNEFFINSVVEINRQIPSVDAVQQSNDEYITNEKFKFKLIMRLNM